MPRVFVATDDTLCLNVKEQQRKRYGDKRTKQPERKVNAVICIENYKKKKNKKKIVKIIKTEEKLN